MGEALFLIPESQPTTGVQGKFYFFSIDFVVNSMSKNKPLICKTKVLIKMGSEEQSHVSI